TLGLLAQVAPSTGDGKAFVIEQALDLEDQVNIFLAIETMAARAFDRLEHWELGLPIAQHKRVQVRYAADFANSVQAGFVGGSFCGFLSGGAVVRHRSPVREGTPAIVASGKGRGKPGLATIHPQTTILVWSPSQDAAVLTPLRRAFRTI